MPLYHLIRKDPYETKYDEVCDMVVSAPNADAARNFANTESGDEGNIWNDASKTDCEMLHPNSELKLICKNMREG